MGAPLLFYSAWGLGYHNQEAEAKAGALARAGWDVVYVPGIGVRNPRLRTLPKALNLVTERFGRPGRPGAEPPAGVRTASLFVLPPRQLPALRIGNQRWVERQLRVAIPEWSAAVAWVRWPTPELVAALDRLQPRGVVYECLDAYHHTPGVTGRWAHRHAAAERRLVAMASATVCPSAALADHLRTLHGDPQIVPHGVTLFPWRGPRPHEVRMQQAVLGFVGTLDYRLDVEVVRHLALARPVWTIRLIGPVQDGFDPSALEDLPNVTVEPAVPYTQLGETLGSFDVGIMPYVDDPIFRHMAPVKTLELLAAGRPVVARRSRALEEHLGVVAFARSPDDFLSEIETALEEDSEERAAARRAVAEANTWDRRHEAIVAIARRVAGR